MDERELETLFSAVPGDPPPATFTADDVAAESRRQTLRRRNRVALTGGAAVVVLAGFGVFGALSGGGVKSGNADSVQIAGTGQPGEPPARPQVGGESPNFSTRSPQQGGDGGGKTGPEAEGTFGCEKVDRELATALAGELPGHFTATGATPGGACTTGARSAGFPVPGGEVSAVVFSRGQGVTQPREAVTVRESTASGGTILLVSIPSAAGQPAPFADQLESFAKNLDGRF